MTIQRILRVAILAGIAPITAVGQIGLGPEIPLGTQTVRVLAETNAEVFVTNLLLTPRGIETEIAELHQNGFRMSQDQDKVAVFTSIFRSNFIDPDLAQTEVHHA